MKVHRKSVSALFILFALVLATAACSTTRSTPSDVPTAGPLQKAVSSASRVAASQAPLEAPAVAPAAIQDERKLGVKPHARPEKPKPTVPSEPGMPEFRPEAVFDPERPAPGEGMTFYDTVEVAPDGGPDVSELDPSIPLNMRRTEPWPEWIQQAKDALREMGLDLPAGFRGDDVGPDVDLASPSTPLSSLLPISEFIDGAATRALGPFAAGWRSYPASSPNGGPPDVSLTVGKDYVIGGYNSYFAVYNKGTGTQAASFNMTTLFSGLTNCGSGNVCDPQVFYDEFNGGSCPDPTDPRYILVALWVNSGATDSRICIAVSKSGTNPTSTANFWKYEWDPAGTGIADYPKIGVSSDALIIGHNWFGTGYGAAAALSKSNLYNGTAPTVREYSFASPLRTPWPATLVGCKQGQTPTYTGTHLALTNWTSAALQLYRWPLPSTSNNPAAYGSAILAVSDCSNPNGTYITSTPIDCFFRQWQDTEQRGDFLYTTRSATGGGGSAIQWAKINVSGGTPTTHSNGTVSETGNYLWMPSVASDKNYDFGLAFSKASQTNSIRVSGAVAGSEGGVWGSVLTAKDGEVQYNSGVSQGGVYRWGDYSGFAPDPEDGCTLWSNTQYARNDTLDDASWIRPYKFSACTPGPTGYLNSLNYSCFSTVSGSIIDTGGAPTNAVYYSTTGGPYPAAISGGPTNYTVAPVTIAQLGAADGDQVWLTFTGSDAAPHESSRAVVGCDASVCVTAVDDLKGGCDNDAYMDRGETINIFVAFTNNESFALPTGFTADLRVDPAFPDANIVIVKGRAEWAALDVGETAYPQGMPFQVRNTGGTNIRTVNFEVYNIRAVDDSWTSTCATGAKFTKIANANDQLGTPYTGFPESYDGSTFPPTNWTQLDVVGTALNWVRATNTVHPAGFGTHSGAGLAYANCYSVPTNGDAVRLQRSADTNTSSDSQVAVQFWMFHDTQYSSYLDSIQLQACTAGANCSNNANWSSFGPAFIRTDLGGGANRTWQLHSVDGSAVAGNQAAVRVGLLATTQYGNDLHIDDVNFAPLNRVADSNTCSGAPDIVLASNYQGPGYGYFLYDTQCNSSGYPDAGETGTLFVYLANVGNETAYGVTATLSCPSCPPGVTICNNTATYGDIPYGSGYVYAAADNGFRVAIPTGLAAGTELPWVVTVNATNPYTTTLNIPTAPYYQSRSGTPTLVDNGDPWGYSIADYFGTAPASDGTTGRYGFSNRWTTTSGVVRAAMSDIDGNGYAARLTGKSSSSPQSMAHTFSTAGVTTDISVYWLMDYAAPSTALLFFEWDNNDGNGWRNFISGGTGLPGGGQVSPYWVTYGHFSLYWQIYNSTGTGYGVAAANACLNNPNFQVRFRCTYSAYTNSSWNIDPFWMDLTRWVNEATSCTGVCLGPEAPVITEVRDVNPCVMDGVKVYFDKGLGTASTNLRRDGGNVVTGYTSGSVHAPGDTASHSYVIRAVNPSGLTDSASMSGADAAGTGTPTITCSPGSCTHTTSVLLSTQAGFSGYQWYRNASPIGGATSATYNATQSGNYTVDYKIGACTNPSAATAVTIGGASPIPGSVFNTNSLRVSKSGASLLIDWGPPGGSCTVTNYGIYRGTLGTWYDHTQIDCDDAGGDTQEIVGMPAGNAYFLVVPFNASAEGSYGLATGGERPRGLATCTGAGDLTACN